MTLQVVWLKRDLRVDDHKTLATAAQAGPVLPLLVVEPDYWQLSDTNGRQYLWWLSCAACLKDDVEQLGGQLAVHIGTVLDALQAILDRHGPFYLTAHQETGNWWTFQRDIAVRNWCDENGIRFDEPMQFGVWRGSLLNRDKWAKMWDRMMAEPMADLPTELAWSEHCLANELPDPRALGIPNDPIEWLPEPGTLAAEQVLKSFLYERGRNYRSDMSSPTLGAQGCSRLSPYLAVGAISMKRCYQETLARLNEFKNDPNEDAKAWCASLRAFIGRLHWHCHFTQKLETDPELEWRPAVRAYEGMRPPSDPELLNAFAAGQTGFPFVDACMRQLRATGWINFRMRAMLMSFACYDLFLRWQDAGLVLARLFTDYDPGIHWTQSQMQSGESGINTLRIYNPIKQGRDHDPDGDYIRQWVPELRDCGVSEIHEPWKVGCAPSYPKPLVDHAAAIKEARNAIWEVRRKPEVRAQAEAVLLKHGSRKKPRRKRVTQKRTVTPVG
ncbi:MAG: FAD-binding domain-containing protein [Parvularcula sp.]|nr:FAD-binding domain-containing protein [Parvularcula sp.]